MSDSNKNDAVSSALTDYAAINGLLQSTADLLWSVTGRLAIGQYAEAIDIASEIDEEKMYGHDHDFLLQLQLDEGQKERLLQETF
uniref:Uncharacterized protein n=1 Tax=Plectus sambesii TaxID=2011161 RepID=A0A914WCA0_9BILA